MIYKNICLLIILMKFLLDRAQTRTSPPGNNAIKRYGTQLRAQERERHHLMQFSVRPRTPLFRMFYLSTDSVIRTFMAPPTGFPI